MRLKILVSGALLLSCLSVVHAQDADSSGTGFFVNSQGWIATNAHVVDGCDRVEIGGHGDVINQHLDRQNDLAVLRVQTRGDVRALPLRQPGARLGEDIVAFGFPLSGFLSDAVKVTTGNVNALVGIENDTRHVQISAPLQPGNSGGPVVDRAGAVVGVAVGVLGSTFTGMTGIVPQNVNFAIRTSILSSFLETRGIDHEAVPMAEEFSSTADLAESVEAAVVQVLCHGGQSQPEPSAQQKQPPGRCSAWWATPSRVHREERLRRDRFRLCVRARRDLCQCRRACEDDRRCQAITYNQPARYCFLKDNAAILIRNQNAQAAYSPDRADDILMSNFTVRSDHDMRGGDYRHIQESSFVGCFVACATEDACRAFAYVRANSSCWLKDRTTSVFAPGRSGVGHQIGRSRLSEAAG